MEAARAGAAAAVVVLVAALLTPAVGGAEPRAGPGPDATGDGSLTETTVTSLAGADSVETERTQVETDQVRLVVSVGPDGDAVWRVEYRTNLDDQNTTEAFESLAADIEANPDNYTDRFADRIRDTVAAAENSTGREMAARNFSVSAGTESITGDVGVITYTYEWTNFARVDGDRLVVGDAIEGFFLNSRTLLEVQWPEGYGVTDVAPAPDSRSGRSLLWRGAETDFGPDQPRVVVTEGTTDTATPTDDGTTTGGDGTAATTDDGQDEGGGFPFVPVLVVLAVVVAAVAVVARRGLGGATPAPAAPDDGDGDGDGDGGDGGVAAGTADGDDTDEDDDIPVDEELLSNEERVLRLLENRGGRIKQQEIVEALDWTEAKTSQVVSGMREEGTIEGFRLGRENVLTLPDTDIAERDEDDGGDDDDEP